MKLERERERERIEEFENSENVLFINLRYLIIYKYRKENIYL